MDRKQFRKEVTLPTRKEMKARGHSYRFVKDAYMISGAWTSVHGASGSGMAYCLNTAAHARLLHRYPEAREALSTARRTRVMYFSGPMQPIWRRMSDLARPHEAPVL